MSDSIADSTDKTKAEQDHQPEQRMYLELEQDRSAVRELPTATNQLAVSELNLQGFPDLSIDNSQDKSSKEKARDNKSPGKAPPDLPPWPPECKENEVDDKGPPYFRDEVSVIGLGDDHSGRHWEGYTRSLETLTKEGLTHVALEMIPKDLNPTIKVYREAKEVLGKAEEKERAEQEQNIEELKQKMRSAIEGLQPKDKSIFPAGLMTSDDLIKMIDMAHEKGLDVVGIEPKENKLAEILESLKDDTSKNGNSIDAELRESAKKSFMDYFKPGASDEERQSAGDVLEKYLKEKFAEDKASEYLKWLADAKHEGLAIPIDAKFPKDDEDGFGDLSKPDMNWRDSVFATEILKLTDKGAKVLVMAGSGHFTKSEGLCDAFKEFRKGVTTLAERLGNKMGHIRSGLRPGQ